MIKRTLACSIALLAWCAARAAAEPPMDLKQYLITEEDHTGPRLCVRGGADCSCFTANYPRQVRIGDDNGDCDDNDMVVNMYYDRRTGRLCFDSAGSEAGMLESVRIRYPADGSEVDIVLENNQGARRKVCLGATRRCRKDSDCGRNGWTGGLHCLQGKKDVFQTYSTFTCRFAGTPRAVCEEKTQEKLRRTCPLDRPCADGKCEGCRSDIQCADHDFWTGGTKCGPEIKNLYQDRAVFGCENGACAQRSVEPLRFKQACPSDQFCVDGKCILQ